MNRHTFSSRILPGYIRFLIWSLGYLLAVFLAFRLLFYSIYDETGVFDVRIRGALGIGMHIDLMVSCYILLLPFIIWSVKFLLNKTSRIYDRAAIGILSVLCSAALLICCADIPYYDYFKSRLTTSIFLWINDPDQSLRFLLHERTFYPFMLLFIGLAGITFFCFRFFHHLTMNGSASFGKMHRMLILLLLVPAMWLGLRGAQTYKAISIRTAFFTNEAFINHLALNPVLTFFDSFNEFQFRKLPDDEAVTTAALLLEAKNTGSRYASPIARHVHNDSAVARKNIVLVMMEGMSAGKLATFGNELNMMPFVDSLMRQSLYFTNFYSSGIHTCNGIYGSLYAMPSIFSRHPMANVKSSDLQFYGLPQVLKANGYQTAFLCSHDEEFDNLGYFLPRNGIDQVISLKDFPREAYENIWGVNDETLFDRSLTTMDSLHMTGKPFFTVILTISTHPPLAVPTKTAFQPQQRKVSDQVFEYADYAIRKFMIDAARKEWYANTMFAFVGDHGINTSSGREAPLALNHVPFFVFKADSTLARASSNLGMQTDIFPTLMRLNGISYINNTMGVDLLEKDRPFAYFSQDKRLCVINHVYYLVIDKSETEFMYKLENGDYSNYLDQTTMLADSMKRYVYSMLQTTQFMIDNDLVGPP